MIDPESLAGQSGEPIDPALLHGYAIESLDRGVSGPDFEAYALLLDGKGPAGTLAELCETPGKVMVLGAGGGTGRQTYELISYIETMYSSNTQDVVGHTISDHDFMGMSRYPEVNDAYRKGKLAYFVADLLTQPVLREAYKLIFAHEVLMHMSDPGVAILNLWKALHPGGTMYMNALANQHGVIAPTLARIEREGGEAAGAIYRPRSLRTLKDGYTGLADQPRAIYKVTKPDPNAWIDGFMGLVIR